MFLPVIGNCPDCGSDEVTVLSRSPATGEVMCQCATCGADYWETENEVLAVEYGTFAAIYDGKAAA